MFFNWLADCGVVSSNPTTKIKISIVLPPPEFYTVGQANELMTKAGNLVGYISLGLFGGIRPEECQKLTWSHINFESGEISIPNTISKTKKPRLFKMEPNWIEWLKVCKTSTEPLVPQNFGKSFREYQKKLSFKWVKDGLRHSYATYSYARDKNLETLRYVMGNSPGIIERHYKGTISQDLVQGYWNIKPV